MLPHPSYWHRTALDGEEVDFLVVGAGIAGVSAAIALREARPDARVLVCDPWGVAGAASGRNAGFLISGNAENYATAVAAFGRDRAAALRRWSIESTARLRALAARHDVRGWRHEEGSWGVAIDDDEDAQLRASAELLAEDGFAATYHAAWPHGRGFRGALHDAADGGVHPVRLLRGLAHAAGLRVEAASVLDLAAAAGGGFAVATGAGVVRAGEVLVCVNAFLRHVLPEAAGWVRPVRGQVLVTAPLPARIMEGVAYCNHGYDYFRQLPDGRVLMGGRRHLHAEEEVGDVARPTRAVQVDLEAFLREHFAAFDDGVAVDYRWAGTMGFSATDLPIIARAPSGVCVAAGFTGHGMSYGTQAGFALADLALGGGSFDLFPPPPPPAA